MHIQDFEGGGGLSFDDAHVFLLFNPVFFLSEILSRGKNHTRLKF